jgi:uncharacterized coiled-coil DUF342 family protein
MKNLIKQFKEALDGALSEKKQRDELNEIVKKLKEERANLIKEYDLKKKEFENLKLQIKKFSTYELLKKKLNALEYKLHFEGENPVREKEISKAMNEIEEQIKKIMPEKNQGSIDEIKSELNIINSKIKSISREIESKALESEKHHKKMLELYSKSDEFRRKISDISSQPVKSEKREIETTQKKQNPELKKTAERLLEDFRKGKKLSFEELQLIQEALV